MSQMTSDVLHSLFQLNGIENTSTKFIHIRLRSKKQNQKKRDKPLKPGQ